ncbi:hypothetical protein [Pedococcus soli]
MRTVKLNRDEFMNAVTINRDNHRAVFEEALEGYRTRMIRELERRIRHVRTGRAVDQYLRLPEPEDHTADYDRVLTMAAMSVDDIVELTSEDFAMYVMDQWNWKQSFSETTGLYR